MEQSQTQQIERTEFGFTRTSCDCWRCSRFCKLFPGYMVPADLPRMMEDAGYSDPFQYGRDHLEASLGAIAVDHQGRPFRVGSIRPACLPQTTICHFLTDEGHCGIHEVSPYGCAFVDDHMKPKDADLRARAGSNIILQDKAVNGVYSQVWEYLYNVIFKRGRDPFAKEWTKIQGLYLQRRMISG